MKRLAFTDAFVDESVRGCRYLMACVMAEARHLPELRLVMRALAVHERVHFNNESARRKRLVLSAIAVALCHTPTACGGTANGVTLLSEEGVARIFDVQYEGPDLNLLSPQKFGMGFGLFPGAGPYPRECGWGGWGGSLAVINLDAQMSFSYIMNRMVGGDGDVRRRNLLSAAYDALMT